MPACQLALQVCARACMPVSLQHLWHYPNKLPPIIHSICIVTAVCKATINHTRAGTIN